MAETATNRKYAWGLQTDFQTQVPLGPGALRKIIATDKNFIDYQPKVNNDAEWSHGYNSETDQWIESHDTSVSHTIPGFAQELGRVFILNLSDYGITTPSGGITAKTHTFKPTNPTVTRQDKAVTYVEKISAGWDKMMPSAVSDGFTLKGSEAGVLTCDFKLLGAGLIYSDPVGLTYPPTATPTVVNPVGLYKFFNTQMGITAVDSVGSLVYGCRYRSFEVSFKKTMLADAGFQPGCARFLDPNNPDSGMIRSAYEFDKQMLDFNFEVDMAAGSREFAAVQDQRPLAVTLKATGAIIEGTIRQELTINIPIARYTTSKPTEAQGMMRFGISGKAFIDVATANLFNIVLTTNVASFATGW